MESIHIFNITLTILNIIICLICIYILTNMIKYMKPHKEE